MTEEELKELKMILGDFYMKYGPTDEVVKLSQFTDKMIVKIQKLKNKN